MKYLFSLLLLLLVFGPTDLFTSEFLRQPAITIGEFSISYFALIIIALVVVVITINPSNSMPKGNGL